LKDLTFEDEIGQISDEVSQLRAKFHRLVEMLRNKYILSAGEYFAIVEDW